MSNTIHDMGGMHGFGPIVEEENEPVFHTEWEGRVYAMNRAMGPLRLWTIDEGRAAQEMLPPSVYLSASYYQRWYLGLVQRALDHGIAGADEVTAGKSLRSSDKPNRIFTPKDATRGVSGSRTRVRVTDRFASPTRCWTTAACFRGWRASSCSSTR